MRRKILSSVVEIGDKVKAYNKYRYDKKGMADPAEGYTIGTILDIKGRYAFVKDSKTGRVYQFPLVYVERLEERRSSVRKISAGGDFHQQLMNEAYDKWSSNKEWNYSDFVSNLDDLHRKAVLIGNMNYQVENGGWEQWYYNRYAEYADEVFKILEDFAKDYPDIGGKVLNIFEEAIEVLFGEDRHSPSFELVEKLWNDYYNGNVDIISKLYDINLVDFRDEREAMETFLEEHEMEYEDENGEIRTIEDPDECEQNNECYEEFERWLSDILKSAIEEEDNYVRQILDRLSNQYYQINEEFLNKFDEWLKKQYEESKPSRFKLVEEEESEEFSRFESIKIAKRLIDFAEDLLKDNFKQRRYKNG